ncbi:hypothetical protein D3C78_837200 [compost metagenome]
MFAELAAFGELVHPAELLVRDTPIGFIGGHIDLALEGAVDVARGQERDRARGADDGGIGDDDVAKLRAHAVGDQEVDGTKTGAVRRRNTKDLGDRVTGNNGIIGRHQLRRIGGALIFRIDDLFGKLDRNGDHRLLEGGVTLGNHREEQQEEKDEAEGNRCHAVSTEAAFSGITALDADITARDPVRGVRAGCGRDDVGHSYCSRYLRTM